MSHADVEMPDAAIVSRLEGILREARDIADLLCLRPHLSKAASAHLQLVILGATSAHEAAEEAAVESDAPVIHRARMLGDYIWTYGNGGKFYPQDPKHEEIDIAAIAHSLSLKCRWTGHSKRFYSVGEHSLHVAEIAVFLAEQVAVSPPNAASAAVHALLHDAGREAYLPDVARPVANYLDATLNVMADACQDALLQALGLSPPAPDVVAVVREADLMALRLEAETLFPNHDPDEENCNLRGIVVPTPVRERFPVLDSMEPPTMESIREQLETTLNAAIALLEREDGAGEVERWQDAKAVVETQEACMVCLHEGRSAPAVRDGLCAACLNG